MPVEMDMLNQPVVSETRHPYIISNAPKKRGLGGGGGGGGGTLKYTKDRSGAFHAK